MYSQTVLAFCFQTPTLHPILLYPTFLFTPPYPAPTTHPQECRLAASAICACHTKHTLVCGNKLCLRSTLSMVTHRILCRNCHTKDKVLWRKNYVYVDPLNDNTQDTFVRGIVTQNTQFCVGNTFNPLNGNTHLWVGIVSKMKEQIMFTLNPLNVK